MEQKDKISIHSARYILPPGKSELWSIQREMIAREMCEEVAEAYLDTAGDGSITKRSHITALKSLGVYRNDIPWIAEHLVNHEYYIEVQNELAAERLSKKLGDMLTGHGDKKAPSQYDGLPELENVTPEIVLRQAFADATDIYVPAAARVSAQKLLAKCLGMEAPKRIDAKVDDGGAGEAPTINLTLNATPKQTSVDK